MTGPRRSDAQQNREAILRAADDAYTENVPDLSLQNIAQRAGVGRATVYRHFSDRNSMAGAVADRNFTVLKAALEAERFEFSDIFYAVLTTQASMRSLKAAIDELPDREKSRMATNMLNLLTPPLRRAQEQGLVHSDVEPSDLLVMMQMLDAGLKGQPDGADIDEAGQKLIGVLIRGITRPGPGRPVPDRA